LCNDISYYTAQYYYTVPLLNAYHYYRAIQTAFLSFSIRVLDSDTFLPCYTMASLSCWLVKHSSYFTWAAI